MKRKLITALDVSVIALSDGSLTEAELESVSYLVTTSVRMYLDQGTLPSELTDLLQLHKAETEKVLSSLSSAHGNRLVQIGACKWSDYQLVR